MIRAAVTSAIIGVVLAAPVTIPTTLELAPKTTVPFAVDFVKVNVALFSVAIETVGGLLL